MNSQVTLQKPSLDCLSSYIQYVREIIAESPRDKEKFVSYLDTALNNPVQLVQNFQNLANGYDLGNKTHPKTVFWVAKNNEVVGHISIKKISEAKLLDNKIFRGGHIGYKIKPSERGKGYATQALKQIMDYCKIEMRMERVLITCNEDNIGSKRVIEKNGGIETRPFVTEKGDKKLRYWLYL